MDYSERESTFYVLISSENNRCYVSYLKEPSTPVYDTWMGEGTFD